VWWGETTPAAATENGQRALDRERERLYTIQAFTI
jgi:hypothetical protein